MKFSGHDLRTESICAGYTKVGACIYNTETKVICNQFEEGHFLIVKNKE